MRYIPKVPVQPPEPAHRPARLLRLDEALERVAASERTYYRDRSILPPAIRRRGRLLFVETEVEAMIAKLAEARIV